MTMGNSFRGYGKAEGRGWYSFDKKACTRGLVNCDEFEAGGWDAGHEQLEWLEDTSST